MKNDLQKTFMLSVVAVILLVLTWLTALPHPALAQQLPPTPSTRTLTVTGSGMASVRPDVAVVTVGVQTAAAAASAALDQNNEQMQALIDTLLATGVVSDDMQTQTVQLQPQIPMPPPGQPLPSDQAAGSSATITTTGYIATNLVEVRVRDLSTLGALLDSVTQAGGNRIEGIGFEVSNPEAAVEQARQMAWENARSSAEKLAQLVGVTLGAVAQVNESSFVPTAPAPLAAAGFAAASVPIAPGAQQVTVNLQVSWQLAD